MKKNIFLILTILGIILPLSQFIPWTTENGFDIGLMFRDAFVNKIASGIALDALFSALVLIVFILFERKYLKVPYFYLPIIGIFLVGLSFAFPFYLFLRESSTKR